MFAELTADVRDVLDVGCGEGLLCRRLREGVPGAVVGLDRDRPSVELARQQSTADIQYRCEDVLATDLPAASFDLVVSVAALHHLAPDPALRAMAGLLRPGGRLVVIGLARSRRPHDLLYDLAGVLAYRLLRMTRSVWVSPAPTVWPPPHAYAEIRRIAERALPGVRYRRHLLFRYSLVWQEPNATAEGSSRSGA